MIITYVMVAVWAALLIAWGVVTLHDRLNKVDYHAAHEVLPWVRKPDGSPAYYGVGAKMDLHETELYMELDDLISEVERG
jgi:hypothetical protein